MENAAVQPHIPESFFEHKQLFAEAWVDRWILPNPFISVILGPLRSVGVELADLSFNKDATTFAETYLNISIRQLNAAVRIGLETVTYIAANPDWTKAPELVQAFDTVSIEIRKVLQTAPKSQEATLAFHVTPGMGNFQESTTALVNEKLASKSIFCGVSVHRDDGALVIDKSVRHQGAAFVRLQRIFPGDATFSVIASRLYEDEISALRLLGIANLP